MLIDARLGRAQVHTYTLTQVYKCAGIAKYSCTLESFNRREAIGLLLLFPTSALAGVQLSVRKCDRCGACLCVCEREV